MKNLDPWSVSEIKDYGKLMREFGMSSFEKYQNRFDSFRYIRRGLIFGHRDFGKIVDSIDKCKPWAMMTGLMPSGRFHLGHKMIADEIIWFQKLGGEIYVCAADMESYLMRDIPFDEAKKTAVEEYLTNYFALGLKKKNLHFWLQSDYVKEYYKLRDMLSKKVTYNELKGIYGSLSTGKIISVLDQAADILHPQLPGFDGPKPVVVPVGADQDPHIRLTRDLANRFHSEFKFIPPCATYHKFMGGLQGGKMSSSDPKSYISLGESPDSARKNIMSAKTGGRATVDEQKKKGGEPEKCMIYELYLYHLIDDDLELSKIYHECKNGTLLCGQDKKRCADLMEKLLKRHKKKTVSALKKASKLL